MSRMLALEYAEKVKKVNKGVIDAFEAGYKQKEQEINSKGVLWLKNRIIGILREESSNLRKESEKIKLGAGYSDLRGSAWEKAMDDVNNKIDEALKLEGKIKELEKLF